MTLGISKKKQAMAASRYAAQQDMKAHVVLNVRRFPRVLKDQLTALCVKRGIMLKDAVEEAIDQYVNPKPAEPIRSKEHKQDMREKPDVHPGPTANQNPTGHWKFAKDVDVDLT